jgi:maltose O-acetyltransferase
MAVAIPYVWDQGRAVLRARWHLRAADSVGAKVRLRGKPRVVNLGRMVIGEKARLDSTAATLELVTERDGLLEIGDHAFLNFGCNIAATKLIRIGPYSLLGPYCMLMDNSYHRIEPERRNERPESKPIVLERNVWLGARTIVLPGVTIGEGACVGAGSVVTTDVAPRTFVAGVPAVLVRML